MRKLHLSCLGLLLTGLLLLTNCKSKADLDSPAPINEIVIDTLYTFADFESQNIASPTDVLILNNSLIAVADYSTQVIALLDEGGEVISTFGRQGRGPGEFLNIRHLYDLGYGLAAFDSHQNMLSYFDYSGELLASHSLPSHALNKDFTLINDSLYVINMEGLNGSLFQLRSLNSDYVFEFGTPNVTWEERGNLSYSHSQLTSGEVPNMQKNRAKLKSNGQHLYVFYEALSEMQKYDLEGNLIWHQPIDLPHNEEIFKGTVESANQYGSSTSVHVLDYIVEFQETDDGLYILTRKPLDGEQILVKLDTTKAILTIYRFPSSHELCFDFDINTNTHELYLASCVSGDVKKAYLK